MRAGEARHVEPKHLPTRYIRPDGTVDTTAIRRELVEPATPGPWFAYDARARVNGTPCYSLKALTAPLGQDCTWVADVNAEQEDAALLAASRTLIPALCDRIDALEREIERLRSRWNHALPPRPTFEKGVRS